MGLSRAEALRQGMWTGQVPDAALPTTARSPALGTPQRHRDGTLKLPRMQPRVARFPPPQGREKGGKKQEASRGALKGGKKQKASRPALTLEEFQEAVKQDDSVAHVNKLLKQHCKRHAAGGGLARRTLFP